MYLHIFKKDGNEIAQYLNLTNEQNSEDIQIEYIGIAIEKRQKGLLALYRKTMKDKLMPTK